MELLGQIFERQIFYCHIRSDEKWYESINFDHWVAFTIVDNDDKHLLDDMVTHCLDKAVSYTCSAGELASLTEDCFDEEIVFRQVQLEEQTGKPQDYESSPMTCFDANFDDGFWFAVMTAKLEMDNVFIDPRFIVCIDCTQQKVRSRLLNLIEKMNAGWIPD